MQWKPRNKPRLTTFKEFHLEDGTVIGVFQGSLGQNPDLDIVVKFKDKYTKSVPRTPKHIHWVIDLLVKKEHNKQLTIEFIKYLWDMYDRLGPFKNKAEQQKCEIKFTKPRNLEKFKELNNYGQYSVEFIGNVIELLSIEEKTGFKGAFMFKSVLTELLETEDIFSIVATATQTGRR